MRPGWVDTLREAFGEALGALEPGRLVAQALEDVPQVPGRVALLAVGKAAGAMTLGALGAMGSWGERVAEGLVVVPRLPEGLALGPKVEVRAAAHPVPDERSVAAGELALALAGRLKAGDLLLALVSGGASALLAVPPAGVSLGEKQALVSAMLDAGAPIQEVNLVRRHLSKVKGGRVAAAASPAVTFTLMMSDVIGGLPHDIGSGPTVPDPTCVDEAHAALLRWAPQFARLAGALGESLDPASVRGLGAQQSRMLATPDALAEALAAALEARGWAARVAPAEAGEAEVVAARRVAQASMLAPGEALVIACEPTITLPARRGEGGRAGWVALAALQRLPPDAALLCAASDGVDGSSGAAGALVSGADAARVSVGEIDAALGRFDDGPLHRRLGTQLVGDPTGHNLSDVHAVVRGPPRR
ncbi:glycerate kinase type-2 family protein [Chondromyces apiculatus]|uniref:D-glycerate 2-kinase n=1 Tax=Chondromyces apiculatus DSM 436 TaxID=1192034 RepID=A0A017SVS0_9BACT|nr:DUF4147 domain-containing protein [Chondromyces apiculatus]EYF00715.1 D-glycerate 2-kinase [Chondromyces apiculatus DSM 436]